MSASVVADYLKKYLAWVAVVYAGLFFVGHSISLPATIIYSSHDFRLHHMSELEIFSACWVAAVVIIYFILARGIHVNKRELFLHMGLISILGPVCEVAINTFCRSVLGASLWVYHFLPVHGGDTSMFSYFVWGMYGCHLYFMDRKFIHSSAAYRSLVFALVLSLDAIVMEFILSLTTIYFLHSYFFYYYPGDLHHLTTVVVIPFYFLGGVLLAEIIQRSFRYPVVIGIVGFAAGFVFTFWERFV